MNSKHERTEEAGGRAGLGVEGSTPKAGNMVENLQCNAAFGMCLK